MPKYRFEFVNEPDVDPIEVDLEYDGAAKAEAHRALAEGIIDRGATAIASADAAIRIYNHAGSLIATVRISEETPDEQAQ